MPVVGTVNLDRVGQFGLRPFQTGLRCECERSFIERMN
jgi:hypothetical protein